MPSDEISVFERPERSIPFNLYGYGDIVAANSPTSFVPAASGDWEHVMQDAVDDTGVSLAHQLVWRTQGGGDGFCHEENIGEKHYYDYPLHITFPLSDRFGTRTAIVHPAMAALDISGAGCDEAYFRALGSVNVMVGVRREEITLTARRVIQRLIRDPYNPYRLLFRAAALYARLCIGQVDGRASLPWSGSGRREMPLRIDTLDSYARLCASFDLRADDILYVRCDHADEMFMVEVLNALTSEKFPFAGSCAVANLWPKLNNPRVVYSGPNSYEVIESRITLEELELTMDRVCSIYDCYDLWQDALLSVQGFAVRARNAGALAGSSKLTWALPASRMRVGLIGPMLASLSVEGMKTEPFVMPSPVEFIYGGAVKGVFLSAAYFEAVRAMPDMNPVVVGLGLTRAGHCRVLSDTFAAKRLWEGDVALVLRRAGWECMTEAHKRISMASSRHNYRTMLEAARVPWWTNVLPFMSNYGEEFLSEWVRPARLSKLPNPGRWYLYQLVGATTTTQVASAIRWLGAEVKFCVYGDDGSSRQMDIDYGPQNRFLPLLQPDLKIGGAVARAILKFPPGTSRQVEFCSKLAACRVELLHQFTAIQPGQLALDTGPGLGAPTPGWLAGALPAPGSFVRPVPDNDVEPPVGDDVLRAAEVLHPVGLDFDPKYLDMNPARPISEADKVGIRNAKSALRFIKPGAMVAGGTTDQQLAILDALKFMLDRALSFAESYEAEDFNNRIRDVIGLTVTLRRGQRLDMQALDEQREAEGETASANPTEALASAAPVAPATAAPPDDPARPTETLQDFGEGTSSPGSMHRPGSAGAVDVPPSLEVIGFLPPEDIRR